MADKVQFELVSPERLLASEEVEMVVVPGTEGDFGVLVDHAPVTASVRPGVLEIHSEGADVRRIFLSGGFCEVTAERCTVLAEESAPVDELDRASLEKRLADAREELEDARTDAERHRAEIAIQLFEDMIRAVS